MILSSDTVKKQIKTITGRKEMVRVLEKAAKYGTKLVRLVDGQIESVEDIEQIQS